MKSLRKCLARPAVCLVLSLAFSCITHSQQPASNNPPATAIDATGAVDGKAHEAAVRLVDALGLKEKMVAGIDPNLDKGVAALKAQTPPLRPEFIEEWRKRMKERMKLDDFVAIVVQVYLRYFTADELDQLSDLVISRKEGKSAELSDALKEKFQKDAVAIQSEIIGGTTQLGARLGGEVGEEIQKEHPEWVPTALQPAK